MNVSISGVSDASATTDASGRYSFTGLRMGNYSVEISGFDSDAVGFSSTASSTSVGVGESKIVSFDGTYLRTAGVSGQVSVEGEGLNGVMVSLRGGPDNVDESTTTDAAGQYAFASLRAGTYTVGISGWDDTDFEFEVTSKSVTVALGETGYVEFEGELLRTSGLAGRVSAGGMGMAGVTVTLSGTAEATANTDASGIYAFAGLAAGDYTVTISGYDAVEYSFDDSQTVTLEMDKTAIVNFDGMALRTASVKVMVTADGEGVAGVTATLTLVTGATSGTILSGAPTGADGSHTFGPLLAGNYRVDISGFDAEIDFAGGTNWQGQVATGAMAEANFAGMINRTGSIAGMVTADGEGMGGVTVTLGGAGDASMMTADDGSYSFSGLRRGDYTVSVTNPNADMYSFPTTSRAVSVAIGQMHSDVSFAGTMIRRSSISGQVSVEGMGLDSVTVTLSGAHDATTMTDASGQYVFNGLGGGSYTVSFENPNGDAYEFDATSADVTVGNAEAATQNFSGMHTRTASVSGMLFVDEVDSNDMHDEGEEMLAAADIELALIGPTIAMRQTANTDAEGNFTFENLRMGTYQLVVGAEGVPADYGYGGPATGYEVEVTAGMGSTQNIPFDITHQTVAFSVMLKSGEMTGDSLPGATVTLYADSEGKDRVASGETDEMGMTSIRFARADAAGNMAYAGVMAPDGFDVAGDMQMVEWASTDKMSEASNSQDVVNLAAEFSFAGKTITTAMGGGKELAGWAINVLMMGEDEKMEAVEDAPEMLDDMGMGSVMMTAGSAADLPMTYYVALADDQDDDMDGGESYVTTDTLMAMHNGLSVDSEMEAGTLEARYTTQTLVVAVYEERDQIPGYTATIDGGDTLNTSSSVVSLRVRHMSPTNRRAEFDPDVWNRNARGITLTSGGFYTFRRLPADANVFVTANPAANSTVEVLEPDVLDAFENPEKNGIMGGAFGPEGGFHHTVSLCPLQSDANQDGAACGSFAFVQTYEVAGHVSKMVVEMDDNDGFDQPTEVNEPDIKLGLNPVANKNLAGEAADRTTGERNLPSSQTPWDDRFDLSLGRMAAGFYSVSVPSGWSADVGKEIRLEDEVADVEEKNETIKAKDEDGPFHATDSVHINVRPSTGTLYGVVSDGSDPIEGAIVTVNGVSAETDIDGRYIVEGYSSQRSLVRDALYMTVSADGFKTQTDNPGSRASTRFGVKGDARVSFAANDPQMRNVELAESDVLATVAGTVTDKDGDPVSGVRIRVEYDGKSVLANPARGCKANDSDTDNCRVTGSDGTYSLDVDVMDEDRDYTITPEKDGYYFDNADEVERLEAGDSEDGVDFEALRQSRIRGFVEDEDENRMADVTVMAKSRDYEGKATTSSNGRFTIWVDGDQTYDVTAEKDGYIFDYPEDASGIRVDDDETHVIDGVVVAKADGDPRVYLNLNPKKIAEDGGMSKVTATLNRPHTADITITVEAEADANGVIEMSDNDELVIKKGATKSTGTVTITSEADDQNTDDGEVTVSGEAETEGNVDGPKPITLAITDDDEDGGKVKLVLTPKTITEGETSTVTATLKSPASTDFEVTVSVSGGGTLVGEQGTLYFEEGSTASDGDHLGKAVKISTRDDEVWMDLRKIKVSGSVSSTTLVDDPDPEMLTVKDDDNPVEVTLKLSRNPIDEADDGATADVSENVSILTASLNMRATADVTVTVTVRPDATASTAYSASGTPGTGDNTYSVTIPEGSLSSDKNADGADKTTDAGVTITATADDTDEKPHTVAISGMATGAPGLKQPASVTLTIQDDDKAPSAIDDLAASAPGRSSATTVDITLTWTAPAALGTVNGEDATVVTYEYRQKTSGQSWGDDGWTTITPTAGTGDNAGKQEGTVSGVAVNNTYQYQVRATATGGPTGQESNEAPVVVAPATSQ